MGQSGCPVVPSGEGGSLDAALLVSLGPERTASPGWECARPEARGPRAGSGILCLGSARKASPPERSNKAAAAPASWPCQPPSWAVTEAKSPASTLSRASSRVPPPHIEKLASRGWSHIAPSWVAVHSLRCPLLEFVERSGGTPLTSSD